MAIAEIIGPVSTRSATPKRERINLRANLGRNIVIEVTGIFWVSEFRAIWRRISVDVEPVDSTEPGVSLPYP